MQIKIVSPTKAYILYATSLEINMLSSQLKYTNTAAAHLVKRHFNNTWYRNKNREMWEKQLEELKKAVNCTVLYNDEHGYFIRPGSIPYLGGNIEIINEIKYPPYKKVAWTKPITMTPYPYQESSIVKLMDIKHGNVELCTGAGKSLILLKICREAGLKTAIVAPGKSIFNELLEKFEYHLGKSQVGRFGDGKKVLGKRFTVCIGDSLANIKPNTPEWEFFSNLDMLIIDESHTWGAETLNDVCHGVLSDVPYRFFLSATQTRGDGSEKLLQSIIGKTVEYLSTKDAVDGGYICKHDFKIVETVSSNPSFTSMDVLELKRAHFLKNRNIAAFIAKLANSAASIGQQTLILVEELEQISILLPLLKVPVVYAHSESKKDRLEELGLSKVKPAESVEAFNKNEAKVLIGTSCVSTGTNIYQTNHTVNWVGGASEIRTKQGAVGRSTRLASANPYKHLCGPKPKCTIWDFDVKGEFVLEKHLQLRIEYYQESGSSIERINLRK